MGDNVYCTDHGSFCILKAKQDDLLAAINNAYPEDEGAPYVDLTEAFSKFGYDISTNNEEDIIDVYLNGSWNTAEEWAFLKETVGPFVEPGSYLVFAFGGVNSVWAIAFNDSENGVVGTEEDAEPILNEDLFRMLSTLKWAAGSDALTSKETMKLYVEMRDKYAPKAMRERLDG
jgi:hypothetical protein